MVRRDCVRALVRRMGGLLSELTCMHMRANAGERRRGTAPRLMDGYHTHNQLPIQPTHHPWKQPDCQSASALRYTRTCMHAGAHDDVRGPEAQSQASLGMVLG